MPILQVSLIYKKFTNDIQTQQYKCSEVILGSKYSTTADMWSFACICFELATSDALFDPSSSDNYERDEVYSETFLLFFFFYEYDYFFLSYTH